MKTEPIRGMSLKSFQIMEKQKQQALPWVNYEEEENQVALLGQHSKPNGQPPVNGGRNTNEEEEEENKNNVAAAAFSSLNNSLHFDFNQNQGTESAADGVSGTKYYPGLESSSVQETNSKDEELHMEKANKFEIQTILITEINHHHLSEISRNLEYLDQKTEVDEDFDQESTEIFDVEGVLKKQNTHDLYCPNCKSCITRRVILLRRKPKIPKIRHKSKPDHQLETPSAADAPTNRGNNDTINNVGSNDGLTPEANDPNPDAQPFIFRCLSCFTHFIPTGNGQVQYKPPSCTNWIFTIFGSYIRKRETNPDAGTREPERSEADGINQHPSTHNMPPGTDVTAGDSEIHKDPETSSSSSSSEEESIPLSDVGVKPAGNDDVVLFIGPQPDEVVPPQRATDVGDSAQPERFDDENIGPEVRKWDILKSIVYGGLGESITSLGVVTSAAATGATTLNIFAMGLANLIGGLFVLAHNIRELKNGDAGRTSTGKDKQEDRYQQLLGRRENFWVHATLVILSFLIYGLMPPVVYGFSFRESDDRDMKIVAVAVSSLACIMLLAIGKARTEKPPARSYMKTVFYYVSIGFTTSGLSYVVGNLIKKLVEELHLFESNLEVTVPFLEPNLMNPGWASY